MLESTGLDMWAAPFVGLRKVGAAALAVFAFTAYAQKKSSIADAYTEVREVPVGVRNIEGLVTLVAKTLDDQEAADRAGDVSKDMIRTNRITMTSLLADLRSSQQDGVSYKNHPLLKELRGRYAELEKRQAALEKSYLVCTWGFQMSDGKVLAMTTDWSTEDFEALRKKAKHETARCWLNKSPGLYDF